MTQKISKQGFESKLIGIDKSYPSGDCFSGFFSEAKENKLNEASPSKLPVIQANLFRWLFSYIKSK